MRLLKPYYLLNLAFVASYFLLRASQIRAQGLDYVTESKEGSVLVTVLLIAVLKSRRAQSLESALAAVSLYMKLFILVALVLHRQYMEAGIYFVLYFVQFVLFPQPLYDGPQRVTEFDPDSLDAAIKDPYTTWLINFYATWAPSCVDVAPVFAGLSLEYTTAEYKFGRINVGRYSEVAEQFNISLAGTTKQLPTLIEFRGREHKRLPLLLGTVVAPAAFTHRDIVEHFRLTPVKQE